MVEKVYRRLPLRDLLTDAEKRARDLIDQLNNTVLARATDLRDLSRPIRRKSHYPTLVALQNSLQKYLQSTEETEGMIEYLDRQLAEIREHARRERFNRG
jgi:C4-dicarboxylate-specific signal transduction histidine kinase